MRPIDASKILERRKNEEKIKIRWETASCPLMQNHVGTANVFIFSEICECEQQGLYFNGCPDFK